MKKNTVNDSAINSIIRKFEERGIRLWSEDNKLKYKAPKHVMTSEDIRILKENKSEFIEVLNVRRDLDKVIINPSERFYPFALTDVQSAYLLGRTNYFEYGGVSCRIYLELEYEALNHMNVEKIWNKLITRHDMLRAVISEDGYQTVFEEVPKYHVEYVENNCDLKELRQKMSKKHYDISKWPLFDVAVSHTHEKAILHFSIEFLIADWASIWSLFSEFEKLYFTNEKLPKIDLTFRDYLIAERKLKEGIDYEKDKAYWMKRIKSLPASPQLPVINQVENKKNGCEFKRYYFKLESKKWNQLKRSAQKLGMTPTSAVMSAYASVLERWSENNKFCLNLTVLNRLPLHKQVNDIVGDFTSVNMLEVNWERLEGFVENAKRLNQQLFDDLDHRLYSGVEVLRQLARNKRGETVLMPIVFTSAIGLIQQTKNALIGRYNGNGISQTPQVFIDCQAMDNQEGLMINWDVREGIFPEGLVDDMFMSFKSILENLAGHVEAWKENLGSEIPKWQRKELQIVNETKKEFKKQYLFTGIYDYYMKNPNKVAVIDSEREITYKQLVLRASSVIKELKRMGCTRGSKVAIMMEKQCYQAIAALGVVGMGAVYVPIDINQPEKRWRQILESTEVKIILSTSNIHINFGDDFGVIAVDELMEHSECEFEELNNYETPAYIIHTSGTTGIPKGVVINHKAVMNTINDINEKFNVTENDKILGLAELSFDLSVYDFFGILSVGGTLIYPDLDKKVDPSHWAFLMKKYNITIWNSVPALVQMFVSFLHSEKKYQLPSFRLVMMSGDRIPITLPEQLHKMVPSVNVISLGGATEASIWSIFYKIDKVPKNWTSIPYGKPLANQILYILDENQSNCPYWCTGEIYISGEGLADEYYGDPLKTKLKFIRDKNGTKLYKTGDKGRYRPGGLIEFIGRKDNQVKINGHRIELGEIETSILKYRNIEKAVVITKQKGSEKILVAFVEKITVDERINGDHEVDVKNIKIFLKKYLPKYMIPSEIIVLDKLPLTQNKKIDRKLLNTIEINSKKQNHTVKSGDGNEFSDMVLGIWREALGEECLTEEDNFYDYGADSLIMAQMAGKLKEKLAMEPFKVKISFDCILRQMINYPTTMELVEYLTKFINVTNEEQKTVDREEHSYAALRFFGKDKDDKLRVLIHGGLGTTSCYKYVIPYLEKDEKGQIVCINISNAEKYCSISDKQAIEILANEYAEMIMELHKKQIQIVGYSLGGLLALEVARCLSEKGATIDDLILIDIPPMLYDINDQMIIELLFVFNLNLKLNQLEFLNINKENLVESIKETFEMYKGNIPENIQLFRCGKLDSELNMELMKMRNIGKNSRFKMYQDAMGKDKLPLEMLNDLYNIFKQSLRIANFMPQPYFGDIRFLQAKEPFVLWKGDKEETIRFWEDVTLGELTVEQINGDHFSCVGSKENAKKLSTLLSEY